MTTRDHARPGERPLVRDRAPRPEPDASLGERLLAARERKGVDLYRAERDTKIRVRYLAALERNDYSELPGTVYTKGFLRNYALYLGLDPEQVLEQYRHEYGASRAPEPVSIVPRALDVPSSGLTVTRGLLVAAILVLAVVAFGGYVAFQLLRFAKPPGLAVTQPAAAVTELDGADRTTLAGTSDPGVTITIQGTGQQPYRVSADSTGHWQQEVALNKGQNEFSITATDPTTTKVSPSVTRIITVPIPVIEAPTLAVTSPNDGAAVTNGAIPVQGTTNGTSVTVSARYLGPLGPQPSKASTPSPVAAPAAKQIAVAPDGSFSDSYQLAPGKWSLTITATDQQEKTITETRQVTVAFTGVDLVIAIKGSPAWLKVWVDGTLDPTLGAGGAVMPVGKTLEFTGQDSVEVRTGSSGSTYFTLNGQPLGALGASGIPETWLFAPPAAPQQTNRK